MTGVTSTVRTPTHYSGAGCTPPHYSTGKGPSDKEEEEEDDDDESDKEDEVPGFHIHQHQRDPYHQDELGYSQLWDALFGTQGDEQVLLIRNVRCAFN
jgi:hypothetical protein